MSSGCCEGTASPFPDATVSPGGHCPSAPSHCLAVPFPVTSWVSFPGAGDRWEVVTGSCCPTLGPSITWCILLHKSTGLLSRKQLALVPRSATQLLPAAILTCSQYPPSVLPVSGRSPGLRHLQNHSTFLSIQDVSSCGGREATASRAPGARLRRDALGFVPSEDSCSVLAPSSVLAPRHLLLPCAGGSCHAQIIFQEFAFLPPRCHLPL